MTGKREHPTKRTSSSYHAERYAALQGSALIGFPAGLPGFSALPLDDRSMGIAPA